MNEKAFYRVKLTAVCGLLFFVAGCGLLAPHTILPPNAVQGPSEGVVGELLEFFAGGASCDQGHSLEYRFDWDDGTYSSWRTAKRASNIWDEGDTTYAVRAQARCTADPSVVSAWSAAQPVTITAIGATRDNGYLAITLQSVEFASEIRGNRPEPGLVYLIAYVEGVALRNIVHLVADAFRVLQADGEERASSGARVALERRLETRTNMYTGDKAGGGIVFEVASGQKHYTLEYLYYEPSVAFRFSL